ncbi:hypothetical protein B0H16DRAFT_728647 [Mycena metata]|uniref:Uncharacterized protein n=1 Tax=Mycena metata TaxID=1033252 RepID=A0AAD7NY87_9AGAR|nr:hypothetical protein B0H16DRAFT_728647 [Mycena metata]
MSFATSYAPEQLTSLRETEDIISLREALGQNTRRWREMSGGTSVARDSRIAADARQTLFCGSEQPFTAGHLNQTSSGVDTLSASLGIPNSPSEREQLPQRSNGCGTQIHRAASSNIWGWSADAAGVSDTVVPLENRYVPREAAAELEAPHREACGCSTQFVGCAACGNPLGSQLEPCQMHNPRRSDVYTFLASAVSPPLLDFTPGPAERTREPPEREPSTQGVGEFLRTRHNYGPDGRRIPRDPPTLRGPSPELGDATRALMRVRAAAAAAPPRRHRQPASFSEDSYRAVLRGERVTAPNTPTAAVPTITPTSVARDRDRPTVQFASAAGADGGYDSWNLSFEPDGSLRLPPSSTDAMLSQEQRVHLAMEAERQRRMREVQVQRMSEAMEADRQARHRQEAALRDHHAVLQTEYQNYIRRQEALDPVLPTPQQQAQAASQRYPMRPRVPRAMAPTTLAGYARAQIMPELPTGATTRVLRVGRASERAGRVAGDGAAGGGSRPSRTTISMDTDSEEDELVVWRRV